MTKKFRIWGLVQDRLSPVFVTQFRQCANNLGFVVASGVSSDIQNQE